MIEGVKLEPAKKVETFDLQKQRNGFLTELFKDGKNTVVYLSATSPGSFKGYHFHRVRAARYVCVKGKMKIILYKNKERQEFILVSNNPQRLYIPKEIATGLHNIGDEEAWLINYPDPAYDPDLKDEQLEYTEDQLKAGEV